MSSGDEIILQLNSSGLIKVVIVVERGYKILTIHDSIG